MNPDAPDGEVLGSAATDVSDPVLLALLEATVSKSLHTSKVMSLLRDHLESTRSRGADDETAARAIALADAAHGAEGIAVIDPYARELAQWVAEGWMSGDEAVAFITALIDAGANLVDPDRQSGPGYQVVTALPGVDRSDAVERGDVQTSVPSARPAEGLQSGAGSQADLIAVAPSDSGDAHVPSNSANSLPNRIGPFYDTAGLYSWFQIDSEAVEALVRSGELLAVMTADGFRLFPAFQIDDGGQPVPRLREVLAELDLEGVDPWGNAVWLNTASEDLGGLTPAAALRTERADDVIRLARQAGAFRLG